MKSGSERPADVGLNVVADHRRVRGLDAEVSQHLGEEVRRGLAQDVGLAPGGVLDRRDERADVQRQPVAAQPVAVLLQGDELSALHDLPEGLVEHAVAEVLPEIAHDDGVRAALDRLELGEVPLTSSFMTSATRRRPCSRQWRTASAAGVSSSSGSTPNPRRASLSSVRPLERAVVLVTKRSAKPSSRSRRTASRAPAIGSSST